MKIKIGIIDYGLGNLYSVKNALEFIGCEAIISSEIGILNKADGLILPGVGAFPDAMKFLRQRGLDIFVKDITKKLPLLGICLGMQMLFDVSYEFGETAGLGLIPGKVVKIDHNDVKIPHMGWNSLTKIKSSPLTIGLSEGDQVYFVHSYKAIVQNDNDLLAITDHGGEITAIVGHGNVFGCQFHPEKSSQIGLKILNNFKEICLC